MYLHVLKVSASNGTKKNWYFFGWKLWSGLEPPPPPLTCCPRKLANQTSNQCFTFISRKIILQGFTLKLWVEIIFILVRLNSSCENKDFDIKKIPGSCDPQLNYFPGMQKIMERKSLPSTDWAQVGQRQAAAVITHPFQAFGNLSTIWWTFLWRTLRHTCFPSTSIAIPASSTIRPLLDQRHFSQVQDVQEMCFSKYCSSSPPSSQHWARLLLVGHKMASQ